MEFMKKPIQLVFLAFVVLAILLSGCASTPIPPTFTPEPTAKPFVMPTGNFQMTWNNYNSQYNSYTPAMITIYKQGLTYTEKEVMTDGSGDMMGITVTPQGTNLKIVEADMAGSDYMLISSSDGSLSYWDNQGLIYSVPLLKMSTSQ
jgi:hypothetical protein